MLTFSPPDRSPERRGLHIFLAKALPQMDLKEEQPFDHHAIIIQSSRKQASFLYTGKELIMGVM